MSDNQERPDKQATFYEAAYKNLSPEAIVEKERLRIESTDEFRRRLRVTQMFHKTRGLNDPEACARQTHRILEEQMRELDSGWIAELSQYGHIYASRIIADALGMSNYDAYVVHETYQRRQAIMDAARDAVGRQLSDEQKDQLAELQKQLPEHLELDGVQKEEAVRIIALKERSGLAPFPGLYNLIEYGLEAEKDLQQ